MSAGKELAQRILQRQDELESIRAHYEPTWETVAEFCAPDAPTMSFRGRSSYLYDNQAAQTEHRGARVYDNTITSAVDRLSAGLESLITPQSEKWHGFSTEEIDDDETPDEKEWAERLRDFLFSMRYSSASNFVPAIQAVYQNVVRFGPAYLFGEEGWGPQHVYYCSIPINEGFVARNRFGEVDIFHRRYEKEARQIAQMFGYRKLPASIKKLVEDPVKAMQKVQLIQAIQPRDERKMYNRDGEWIYIDEPFASYHVLEDEEEIVKEKSFAAFPVACFNWRRAESDAYGLSPTINALATVREINAVVRSGLRALQQTTDPATASKAELDFVPILNPGENYPGLIGDDGRPLIAPINNGANPGPAFQHAGNRREDIKDMLFVNLFQVLIQNPQMTATEALIRQEEKGALLGPSGSIIQRGIGANSDRELSILEAKGLYEPRSRFAPPESLQGKQVRPTFTSPLDILRKAAEVRDTDLIVTKAVNYAKASGNPRILDRIDEDEYLNIAVSGSRAPQRLIRSEEEVEKVRAARADAAKAQAGMAAAAQAAKVAKDAVPALDQARQSGMLDQLQGLVPAGNA